MPDSAEEIAPLVVTNQWGRKIYLDPNDARGQALASRKGDANPYSLLTWRLALDQGAWDIVLDVGASYGEMIANVDLSDAGRIVAFEPNAALLPYLARTAEELPWAVEVEPIALGNENNDSALLTVDLEWSGSSSLTSKSGIEFVGHDMSTRKVRVATLDSYLRGAALDRLCMKVDVEGAELDVLLGGESTFARARDVLVMLEILHLSVEDIALLARKYAMFVLDTVDERLVRVFGSDRLELGQLLHNGRLHRQDALIVTGTRATDFEREIRSRNRAPKKSATDEEFPRRAVYTALLGGYETLQEQPVARSSTIPFICLTDDPSLTSETWDVRLITPAFPLDIVRSARSLKIVGHESLAAYNQTIWVDNRVTLTTDPETLFAMLAGADLVAIEHSFREALVDEFDAVVNGGYDDPARVYEQLIHYAELAPDVLDVKPIWTGLLVRRVNDATSRAMRTWMDHVLRYSRRDQLSAPFAIADSGIRVSYQRYDNRESPWHVWPRLGPELSRRPSRTHAFSKSIRSPLARLREIEAAELRAQAMQESADARDARIASLNAELQKANKDLQRAVHEIREIRRSRSFKLAQKVSRIRSFVRFRK